MKSVTPCPTQENPTIDRSRGPSVISSARKSNGETPPCTHSPSKAQQGGPKGNYR